MHWLIQSMPVLCESLVTPCQLRPPPLLKEHVHNYNSEWELVNIVRSTQIGPGGGWEKEGATHSSQASRGSSLEGLMGAVGCGSVARKTDSRYLHTARFLAVMIRRAASKWSCPSRECRAAEHSGYIAARLWTQTGLHSHASSITYYLCKHL